MLRLFRYGTFPRGSSKNRAKWPMLELAYNLSIRLKRSFAKPHMPSKSFRRCADLLSDVGAALEWSRRNLDERILELARTFKDSGYLFPNHPDRIFRDPSYSEFLSVSPKLILY